MPAVPEPASSTAADFAKMTRTQKLAALLILLGPESAAQILKALDEAEVEAVTGEMAQVGLLSLEIQTEVLREFSEVAVQASSSIRGGVELAQSTLEKALGLFKASTIMGRVAPSRTPVAAMQQIAELEPRQAYNLLKQEQPQAIALVLSYVAPDKASQVLAMLPADTREQVVERLATLAPTPVEVVEALVEVLNRKLGAKHTRALRQTGGVKAAADLLNALDKDLSKALLVSIEERNPDLGASIRHKMFTFEDVAALDAAALQKILREVETRDLAIALKNASESLKAAMLGCISKRAAETVNEEISFMGPLKLRDIEAAQIRIIQVVRRLESEGEIDLSEAVSKRDEVLA